MIKKSQSTLFTQFIKSLSKGKARLSKKYTQNYLNYYSTLIRFSQNSLHTNLTVNLSPTIIPYFFGCEWDWLSAKLRQKQQDLIEDSSVLFNASWMIPQALKKLFLGVGFSYITNIVKGKRKIKNTILKPKFIFGNKRVKESLKHLTNQILKSPKMDNELNSLLSTHKESLNISSLSLQSRLNWTYTHLFFNFNESIFYKRKWAIFLKFYKTKAPMYF